MCMRRRRNLELAAALGVIALGLGLWQHNYKQVVFFAVALVALVAWMAVQRRRG